MACSPGGMVPVFVFGADQQGCCGGEKSAAKVVVAQQQHCAAHAADTVCQLTTAVASAGTCAWLPAVSLISATADPSTRMRPLES